ncbi:MAG TPA: ROK family protein [Candidatus Brocadiia bacterium]|nr:ROK family protein [Candidatus Brocadiia bacterium]
MGDKKKTCLVMDIGGTNFSLGLAEQGGRLLECVREATDREGGADWMIARLTETAKSLMAASSVKPVSCGISFGGPADFERQICRSSTHVGGWADLPLPRLISESLGIPAVMDNDANVAALGEHRYGAGVGLSSIIFYTVSTGIGGGIILDGKPYRGRYSAAGEFGHSPVWPGGPECPCGNRGCLEAVCSGDGIARRARKAVRGKPEAGKMLLASAGGDTEKITAKLVFQTARAGDSLSHEIIEETGRYFAMSIATAFNVLDLDLAILGGGVSLAGEQLLAPIRENMKNHLFGNARKTARVTTAKLGLDSCLLGALALAEETFA